jgi:hypothetical protein
MIFTYLIPKRSSRQRLLRKDIRYYPYSSSRCLVLDHCQYFSCVARSCKPSCCQCYFLGRDYETGFGLYYLHLLLKVYHSRPDVMFKPGPFYLGDKWLGLVFNSICISWTLFICVIFSIPTILPVTELNMNYASVSFCLLSIRKCPLPSFKGNLCWSYYRRLVSLNIFFFLPFTLMLTIIGVVYNSISPLSTGTTTGQSQTLMMIQSARFSNQKLNFILRYEMAPNLSWPS